MNVPTSLEGYLRIEYPLIIKKCAEKMKLIYRDLCKKIYGTNKKLAQNALKSLVRGSFEYDVKLQG